MPEPKSRNALKPFCPVHHWRMAYDSTTGKAWNSAEVFYRCSFETCTMRFSVAAGYYDSNDPSGGQVLLAHLETLACQKDRDHHPCIVSYAKESMGSQTEEWRQWRCFTDNCSFTVTQKLSQDQTRSQEESLRTPYAARESGSTPLAQYQRSLARR